MRHHDISRSCAFKLQKGKDSHGRIACRVVDDF